MDKFGFFLVISIVYVGGLVLLLSTIQSSKQSIAASSWPFVIGKIVNLSLKENVHKDSDGHRSTTYEVKVKYSYSVMGREYNSFRLAFGYIGDNDKKAHQEIFEKLQKSYVIKVRYNPNDPSISTLSCGIHRSLKLKLNGAMILFAFAFAVSLSSLTFAIMCFIFMFSIFLISLQSDNVLLKNIEINP